MVNKRTNDYSLSRIFNVGQGSAFAFFFLGDGASLESHTATPSFRVKAGARWQIGYLFAGKPVSGGYLIGTNAAGTTTMQLDNGSESRFFDAFGTSVQNCVWVENPGSHQWQAVKLFSLSGPWTNRGSTYRKTLTIEGKGSGGIAGFGRRPGGGGVHDGASPQRQRWLRVATRAGSRSYPPVLRGKSTLGRHCNVEHVFANSCFGGGAA